MLADLDFMSYRTVRLSANSVPQIVLRAAAGARVCGAGGAWGTGASCWRSVIEFRNLTDAISRLSIMLVVFDSRNMCESSNVMATNRPEAVLFIATEMAAARRLAFSAGFAVATALNAPMRPVMVPNRPMRRPTFASEDR